MLIRVVISFAILFFFSAQHSSALTRPNCAGNGASHVPIRDDQRIQQNDSARDFLGYHLFEAPASVSGIDDRSVGDDDSEQHLRLSAS